MANSAATEVTSLNRDSRRPLRVFFGYCSIAAYIVAFILLAGHPFWIRGWLFNVLLVVTHLLQAGYLRRRNPDLHVWRAKMGANTESWDKQILAMFMLTFLATILVGAWEGGRLARAAAVDVYWCLGAALYLGFLGFMTWAMAVNPHFEKTVRIQRDRDHRVISSGPYGLVRHPGYVGVIIGYLIPFPLLLGSRWAAIPAGLAALIIVVRTALEDRTLRRGLAGYEDYTKRVRYRLVPGIW